MSSYYLTVRGGANQNKNVQDLLGKVYLFSFINAIHYEIMLIIEDDAFSLNS